MENEEVFEKGLLILAKALLNVEAELAQLKAGLTALKSEVALELHREDSEPFLERLRQLETMLLAVRKQSPGQKQAAEVIDVLLRHDPNLDPDA
jgi:hypothetical protein